MRLLKNLVNQFNPGTFPGAIWAVAGIQCISGMGWATSFTYLPLYLYQERGLAMTLVGVLQLFGGLASGAFQIVGGILGDRFGHRRTALLFGMTGLLASVVLATFITIRAPIWSVIIASALVQILGAGTNAPLNAIVANAAPKDRMTESYSLLAVIGNIAWAVGPLLGGFLLGFTSFGWLFGIGVSLKALAVLGISLLPDDSRSSGAKRVIGYNLKAIIPNPALIIYGVLVVLFFLTLSQWGGTLSVFTIDRLGFSTGQYGLLMSISSILIIVFQYPVSRRVAGKARVALVLGCLFYAFGFLSLTWVKAFLPAVGSTVIMITGEMLFTPTAIAVVGKMSTSADRGKSLGYYGLCTTLGLSIGPLMGGFLLDKYPVTPLFLWGPVALCSFIAAIGFAFWRGYVRSG